MPAFPGKSFREGKSHGRIPLLLPELLAPFEQMALSSPALVCATEAEGRWSGEKYPAVFCKRSLQQIISSALYLQSMNSFGRKSPSVVFACLYKRNEGYFGYTGAYLYS